MQTAPIINLENVCVEDDRTGLTVETLKRAFLDNLFYVQGKFPRLATQSDYYMALAYTVRDRLLQRWHSTAAVYTEKGSRTVAYLSAEFLMGPQLGNNLINLGIYERVEQAMQELGLSLSDLLEHEEEPGLGNGGLGRLAACYQDSLATLEIPALGYGIRYEFGIFKQDIRDGWQIEATDKWLRFGNPWELPRPEWAVNVKLGGHTESYLDAEGAYRVRWIPYQVIKGIPYDTPILGYQTNTCNTLRLWSAEAPESFDFDAFNSGDYLGAVHAKMSSETLSKVLYPNDNLSQGKQLRLAQQIFFVSCSLQDMMRILQGQGIELARFHEKFTVQLNDTHPAIAVAELMRLLVDEHQMSWEQAWSITQQSVAYTNHTLMPEALERWPVDLFSQMLPRHLEIIYEINHHFLEAVRAKFPNDSERIRRMSLIDESGERYVRMANLACVGSYAINGVAALHTELLKTGVLQDFYEMYPQKFKNKTNGVTPRRFMMLSNPRLTTLLNQKIGNRWGRHLEELKKLEAFADDAGFQHDWWEIKHANKRELAHYIEQHNGVVVDPSSLFDIQVKRIHEYKRQHLNVLHIISLYQRLKDNPSLDVPPRTFLFGGKAAPGYRMAKLMIKLITSVADVINNDPAINDRIKVIFLKNFNVKLAQHIYPAADLSEQVSMAGKEASGTGNMKFAMNGALTIGTLDGANVEIREEVGAENFFLFGLTAAEVKALKASGYNPWDYYQGNPELKSVIDRIAAGDFSGGNADLFMPLLDSLLNWDPYLLLADYQSYIDRQLEVGKVYCDRNRWTKMSILNAAHMGKFSSDRSIRDYCDDIWRIDPVQIELTEDLLNGKLVSDPQLQNV
ncbi:MAG: glycogen/starch/alpha-glucan phosphorylase [Leptolyngbya sp. SIO4C1]|nr:glycogen/starch/alpha-glucan phosphorylase [Leptolyngbya sp. SIO4C1]